jgi:hypothetical protein
MLAPIRAGADLTTNCSETEQFEGDGEALREIWLFNRLIYDRRNSRARRTRAGMITKNMPSNRSGRIDNA